ncbi:hypothetical protein C8250_033990 [Streptomyces sp. So13.3]|uniref:hypothetical protein n=1 Tax=Streptomyces TaxID=1883 RepID=UPI0011060977|nr:MULTISPECIES: hypothetical protein [Streptomyces]MCZ4102846.1 hypothetical protein [Streptomyces sp. H39-C1]NEA77152.1 hypothetical protein [Streptomyces sp. SID13588]QNA76224.1 hypothetical protein C8250_033990 [Streptomyces sp. So13.3]
MRRTIRIGPFRFGAGRSQERTVPGPVSRDRFAVDVAEGLMGVGVPFRRGCSALGFRVLVTDKETGRRQYVSESYTHDQAYANGQKYITELVTGRKRVK